eukprot:TRINITY_DN7206_c0_g1_i1.p1 TRINITY_DN7206_c0_g1~~TRINITY_DN7206_c0_g1_i1.p1  ORF type:complete len:207 (-),score=118.12 TRINITY_DN7206_c0_g1_i1:18-566(-)
MAADNLVIGLMKEYMQALEKEEKERLLQAPDSGEETRSPSSKSPLTTATPTPSPSPSPSPSSKSKKRKRSLMSSSDSPPGSSSSTSSPPSSPTTPTPDVMDDNSNDKNSDDSGSPKRSGHNVSLNSSVVVMNGITTTPDGKMTDDIDINYYELAKSLPPLHHGGVWVDLGEFKSIDAGSDTD